MRILFLILLPVIVLLKYQTDKLDGDVWWHIAHGRYFVTNLTTKIDMGMFAWTPTDPGWIYNTWLGSSIVYLFHYVGGFFGLWVMQWVVFLGVFASFWLFLKILDKRVDPLSATIIAFIAVACSMSCRYYKPEIFSALMFAWTVFLYFYIKAKDRPYLFYVYPLAFAVWVNLHGAFIMGLAFLIIAFAGGILNRIINGKSVNLTHFGISIILSCLATLLNPYGLDYIMSLVPIIQSSVSTSDKSILAYQSMWYYYNNFGLEFFRAGYIAWIEIVMFFTVAGLWIYQLIVKKSCDFAVLLISIALFYKGMETCRMLHFWPIAFFFVFYYLLEDIKIEKWIPVSLFSALFVFTIFITVRYTQDAHWFGKGLDDLAPVQEVNYLKQHNLGGHLLFNDYLTGAYLVYALYPDYKVFIDPRGGLYSGASKVFDDYMDLTSREITRYDVEKFRKKYPFKIAIIRYSKFNLITALLKADFRLLYYGWSAVVLVHNDVKIPASALVDIRPQRFEKEKCADSLFNVFKICSVFNKEDARYIRNVFNKNVSGVFCFKEEVLETMDGYLARRRL